MDAPTVAASDPIAYAAGERHEAQEELLETAEAVLDWLDDRRAHYPPELLDAREGKHSKRLRAALRTLRDE